MRKIYYGLVCLFLFISCSDNDAPKYQELSKLYIGNELSLTLNDVEVKSKSVKFQTSDLQKGEVELTNLIPGESYLKVVNLSMEQDGTDRNLYHLSGESVTPERTITVKGVVGNGMKMNVAYKATTEAVNHWKLAEKSTVEVTITPSSPDATANMQGIFWVREVPVSNGTSRGFDARVGSLFTTLVNLMLDLDVNFQQTGDLVVGYKPSLDGLFNEGFTPQGLIKYNIANERLYLALDIAGILPGLLNGDLSGDLLENINIEQIISLVQQINQGLPIGINMNSEKLQLTLSKEVLLPYFQLAYPLLVGNIEELFDGINLPSFVVILTGISGSNLAGLVGEILRVMEESPQFDITISLEPIPTTSN